MMDEGYIKFDCVWENREIDPEIVPVGLLAVRDDLHRLGLLGVYEDSGIGFGNVSVRLPDGRICISGSATGGLFPSSPGHFALVSAVDFGSNRVWCSGLFPASSETMTHAVLYQLDDTIQCVLHVHSKRIWNEILWKVPTTRLEVPYGTVEMTKEVRRLFHEEELKERGLFAMAGHEEGIVAFGRNPEESLKIILAKS